MFDPKDRAARVFAPRRAAPLAAAALCAALLPTACSQAPPPFEPKSTVGQLMHDVVYPRADEVWKSVGTIVTEEGTEEIRPRTDLEWEVVHSGARTLMETGNLLMMEGRAKDTGQWMEYCRQLIEASAAVLESAEAYDADAVFERGELIYNACRGCHWEYRYEDDPGIMRTR